MYGTLQAQSHINILQKWTERDMIRYGSPYGEAVGLGYGRYHTGTITDTRVCIPIAARFLQ